MTASPRLSRRQFIGTTAATATAAAATWLHPSHSLQASPVPANRPVRVGYIGCGSQGLRQLLPALRHPDLEIVAVCDPNRESDDYPEWGRGELNEKVRAFLEDPDWARDARGGRCGREVGLRIVRHFQTKNPRPGRPTPCRAYADFREMLDRETDLDAVYIMTPEHLHAVIAVHAMRRGKHVLTHKPIANILHEVRVARDTARASGVATQLFCAASVPSTPQLAEWIGSGAIGAVREVHNWSSRPFWPQGMTELPAGSPPVPEGLDWDLWLGPVPPRSYHPAYTHAVFRGWYDFGTGALGDMGHYSLRQVFTLLKLGSPSSVEASRSQFWDIRDFTWARQVNRVSYPRASLIRWEFPGRGDLHPVTLHWYDGGLRPPLPRELETDGLAMPEEGLLFVGDRGKILADFLGGSPRLIPRSRAAGFTPPPPTLPRPIDELDQFVRACRGGTPAEANFESAYPFSETILLGTIALRVDQKLRWDAEGFAFTNSDEANALRTSPRRAGWAI